MSTPVGIGAVLTALLVCLPVGQAGFAALVPAQYKGPAAPPDVTAPSGPVERVRPVPRRRPVVPEGEDSPEPGAISDQCEWLGKRIIGLLVRDDAMAANDFIPFYQRFGCSEEHLAKSFGCVVTTIGVIDNSAIADHIDVCWSDPAARPEPPAPAASPAAAEPEKKPAANEAKPEKKAAPPDPKPTEPKPAEPRPAEPKPAEPGQKAQ